MAWKNRIEVVQTAGTPPSSGRTILATIGWTRNSRLELSSSVRTNGARRISAGRHAPAPARNRRVLCHVAPGPRVVEREARAPLGVAHDRGPELRVRREIGVV